MLRPSPRRLGVGTTLSSCLLTALASGRAQASRRRLWGFSEQPGARRARVGHENRLGGCKGPHAASSSFLSAVFTLFQLKCLRLRNTAFGVRVSRTPFTLALRCLSAPISSALSRRFSSVTADIQCHLYYERFQVHGAASRHSPHLRGDPPMGLGPPALRRAALGSP